MTRHLLVLIITLFSTTQFANAGVDDLVRLLRQSKNPSLDSHLRLTQGADPTKLLRNEVFRGLDLEDIFDPNQWHDTFRAFEDGFNRTSSPVFRSRMRSTEFVFAHERVFQAVRHTLDDIPYYQRHKLKVGKITREFGVPTIPFRAQWQQFKWSQEFIFDKLTVLELETMRKIPMILPAEELVRAIGKSSAHLQLLGDTIFDTVHYLGKAADDLYLKGGTSLKTKGVVQEWLEESKQLFTEFGIITNWVENHAELLKHLARDEELFSKWVKAAGNRTLDELDPGLPKLLKNSNNTEENFGKFVELGVLLKTKSLLKRFEAIQRTHRSIHLTRLPRELQDAFNMLKHRTSFRLNLLDQQISEVKLSISEKNWRISRAKNGAFDEISTFAQQAEQVDNFIAATLAKNLKNEDVGRVTSDIFEELQELRVGLISTAQFSRGKESLAFLELMQSRVEILQALLQLAKNI